MLLNLLVVLCVPLLDFQRPEMVAFDIFVKFYSFFFFQWTGFVNIIFLP